MNILLGILPTTEGDVLIGGVSVKKIGIDTLRGMVGTVLQDDILFAGSIGDNISLLIRTRINNELSSAPKWQQLQMKFKPW